MRGYIGVHLIVSLIHLIKDYYGYIRETTLPLVAERGCGPEKKKTRPARFPICTPTKLPHAQIGHQWPTGYCQTIDQAIIMSSNVTL